MYSNANDDVIVMYNNNIDTENVIEIHNSNDCINVTTQKRCTFFKCIFQYLKAWILNRTFVHECKLGIGNKYRLFFYEFLFRYYELNLASCECIFIYKT